MLFKLLIIGGLGFYLFRLISKPNLPQSESEQHNINDPEEYTDYEEID